MDQRKVSAHYYLLEDLLLEAPCCAALKQVRPLSELQLLAGLVWAREKGKGKCPEIRPQPSARGYSGYYYGRREIRLIREHYNLAGVLHELAHALGTHDKLTHGPAFRKRCLRLYKTYGGWSGEVDW